MIQQIKVANFQSLRRLEVRLGRFTVVTGPTGTGKSAFIRAVRLLAFNARGTSYITRGQKTCAVTMGGDELGGDVWQVGVQRGAKDAYQLIDRHAAEQKTFTKLASKVPEQVTEVLRLDEVNFAGQFDRPYLLDVTGSEVARVLGRLTNVTLLYRAAQEANRRRLGVAGQLKVREADLAALEKQKVQYATLPAEQDAVEAAERSMDILRWQLEPKRERLTQLLTAVQLAQEAFGRVASLVFPEPPSLARLEELVAGRQQLMQRTADLVNAEYRCDQVSRLAGEETKREQQAQQELGKYTAQWGVCPACGQPVRKKAHSHD